MPASLACLATSGSLFNIKATAMPRKLDANNHLPPGFPHFVVCLSGQIIGWGFFSESFNSLQGIRDDYIFFLTLRPLTVLWLAQWRAALLRGLKLRKS